MLEGVLADAELAPVVARAESLRLQILLTPLPRRDVSEAETLSYRVGEEYVFTASAIKTFVSVLALRKLQGLDGVDADTPVGFCVHPPAHPLRARCPGEPTPDDTNTDGGVATLVHEPRKMHLVSNNAAFNRLYDFVGHDQIHREAERLGFGSLRLRHRMGQSHELGRDTPPMVFFPRDGRPRPMPGDTGSLELEPTAMKGIEVGRAHLGRGRRRVEAPRDFAQKNHVSLEDLHRLLASIVRPELEMSADLGLTPANRARLLDAMTEDPLESKNPRFGRARFSGRRYKLMFRGIERVVPAEQIRYVNKAGRAYGFHVESAYVEHRETGRGFLLTAAIYVNENGVVGDDEYEYEAISRPFYQRLGELLARRLLIETGPTAGSSLHRPGAP